MRFLTTLITLGILGYGLYWLNETKPELKYKALDMIQTGTFQTLESHYTPNQIMEKQHALAPRLDKHQFSEPKLKFHPYLMMEVKFTQPNQTTKEGFILWDLLDGEMVINTKTWEKTHGFADCMQAHADQNELKILNLLSQAQGGSLDRQTLLKNLNVESMRLDSWINRCLKKKLIVQKGNQYRLHFNRPKIDVIPATSFDSPVVTKTYRHTERTSRRYSPAQVKKIAQAAFENDFAIRNTVEIFLPIYSITIQHAEGGVQTDHWNAFNGEKLASTALIE